MTYVGFGVKSASNATLKLHFKLSRRSRIPQLVEPATLVRGTPFLSPTDAAFEGFFVVRAKRLHVPSVVVI